MKPLVLIVEDEAPLVALLRYNLEKEGFAVAEAADGEEALLQIAERRPDAVLLDWMLPLVSGIEVCRQIRRAPATRSTPVIMLTARGEEGDRVRGLNSGADDYVVKPFSLSELIARLRAVIRRAQPTRSTPVIMLTARGEEGDRVRGLNSGADDYVVKPFSLSELIARLRAVIRRAQPNASEQTLRYADVTMDLVAHRVTRAGKAIHLGPTEFRLLRHFLQQPRRVFSREQLLDQVWSQDAEIELRTVDVHIRRLRKALNEAGAGDLLRTVRSVGYALDRTR
ncbi:MAG: response regulator [Alphaproteobacteria bacterium]|nr:MAG: response regulator [Alphaproteobacteria bacterium]